MGFERWRRKVRDTAVFNLPVQDTTKSRPTSAGTSSAADSHLALSTCCNKAINEDGIFVYICSYCDSTALLRLCTLLTKPDAEHRCELAVKEVMPPDSRRTKPIHGEKWATVLRERIALVKRLVFTNGNPRSQLGESIMHTRKHHASDDEFAHGICGGPQVMRQGIHRAVFCYIPSLPNSFTYDGMMVRFGIVAGEESITTERVDFSACHNVQLDLPRRTVTLGLEYNMDIGLISVFQKNSQREYTYLGEVRNPSALEVQTGGSYCWAADVWGQLSDGYSGGRSFSIKRPSHDGDFSFNTAVRPLGPLAGYQLYYHTSLAVLLGGMPSATVRYEGADSELYARYQALTDTEKDMYAAGRHYINARP